MHTKQNQISVKQLMYIYMTIVLSPLIRIVPTYVSAYGKQAGWLAPLVSFVPMLIIIYISDNIFKRYKTESLSIIIEDIMTKPLGILIVFLYFLWSTLLTAIYIRYDAERLTGSIYPYISFEFFIIFTLLQIAYVLRTDLTVIARMNEVIMPIIFILFTFLILLLLPLIRTDNIFPVSYIDTFPVIKASLGSSGIFSYYFLLFFLSDRLSGKNTIKKTSFYTIILLIICSLIMLLAVIGLLGSSVTQRIPIPFLMAVKNISALHTIENVESILVAVWICADFILISAFIIISLNIFKTLFKLTDIKPLQNIYILLVLILSLGIGSNKIEMEILSKYIMIPANQIFGFVIPIIIFIIGKLRKKL